MRRSDLSPALRAYLVKCPSHPHCHALVAPPTPRRITLGPTAAESIARASQALEGLRVVAGLLPNADMVTRTLARREAVHSSQIEGTRTQLHELLEYEATRGRDGLPADAQVTQRYVEALEAGLAAIRAGGRTALDIRLLKSLHAILMQDAPAAMRPGQYRDTQAWIGQGRIEDAVFVPAPPDAIAGCMDEFATSMLHYAPRDDEQWQLPLVMQVAITHAQFETIHPFSDGNGRVGRLLMPLLLAAEGLPPLYLSGTLLRQRRAYYEALAEVQLRGVWDRWITLLSSAIVAASGSAVSIARDLDAIRARWLAALSDLRADASARRLPGFLLGHPVVSVTQVADAFGVSFLAANRAIEHLVARGILEEPTRRRNRVFHAREVLERLEKE